VPDGRHGVAKRAVQPGLAVTLPAGGRQCESRARLGQASQITPGLPDPHAASNARRAHMTAEQPGNAMGRSNRARFVDVIIVGAGLSGIGAACRLRQRLPELDFVVWSRGTRSAAPGTSSATRACAPPPTCTASAIASGPGRSPASSLRRKRSVAISAPSLPSMGQGAHLLRLPRHVGLLVERECRVDCRGADE
jgi:hypothetical protein